MKQIYIGYDKDFYVNQYSDNNTNLTLAYMDDNLQIEFGYTKIKLENDKYVLYNQDVVNELYIDTPQKNELILNLRQHRAKLLQAFDRYKINVSYGITIEDAETKEKITSWYHQLLDLNEEAFKEENIPPQIKYYL